MVRLLCFCCAAAAVLLLAAQQSSSQEPAGNGYEVKTDDTDRSTRGGDKEAGAQQHQGRTVGRGITADEQAQDISDMEITRKIRRAIVEDEGLSLYADNIMIITRGGMVTLKGMVKTQVEKNKIMEKAAGIVGRDKVTDTMEVNGQKE